VKALEWLYQNTGVSQTTQLVTGSSRRKSKWHTLLLIYSNVHQLVSPSFRNASSCEFFSNLPRVLPEEKTEFTHSVHTSFHLGQVIAGGNREKAM